MYDTPETLKALSAGIFLTLLLVLVSGIFPIGIVSIWLIPLPVLFYRARLNRNFASLIPLSIIFFMVIIGRGFTLDLLFLSGLLLLGFLLSESFERLFSLEQTILFSCGGVFAAGCLVLFFYSIIANIGYVELISQSVDKSIALTLEIYKEIGALDEQRVTVAESRDTFILILTRFLPGITAVLLIFSAWINILVAGSIFHRHNISFAGYGQLKLWQAPDKLVWPTIICITSFIMIQIEIIQVISFNIIMVLMLVYFLQGIAITGFFFDKKRIPKGLKILLYGLMIYTGILILFVIGIGFFDMWVNFRKPGTDKTGTLND